MDVKNFRHALLNAGIRQKEFAERIGVSGPTLTLFLQGKMTSARIEKAVVEFTDAEWKKMLPRSGTKAA